MLMSRNYFSLDPKSNPLMHFWSLAVEEQFYLLWPLVIVGLLAIRSKFGEKAGKLLAWVLVVSIIYGTCRLFVWFSIDGPTVNDYSWFRPLITRNISPERLAFYSPLTRSWEFVAGVGVALAVRSTLVTKLRLMSNAFWLIGAVFAGMAIRLATITPGYEHGTDTATNTTATILVVLGTSLVLLGGEFNPWVSRVLAVKPLTIIGDWSYSVYLWHWPIWVLLITTFNRSRMVTLAALVLSMMFGWAQFRWIEGPIRDGLRLPRVNFGRLVGGFVAVAVLVYGLMSFVTPAIGKYVAGHKPEEISAHIIEKP
jgi:peptidoglycan/LPS O-acetylase OafA/YrhL